MTTHLIAAIKSGIFIATTTGAVQLVEEHTVSLPTVGAVGLIVFGGMWKLSTMLERIQIETNEVRSHTREALERIETKVDKLPCVIPRICKEK